MSPSVALAPLNSGRRNDPSENPISRLWEARQSVSAPYIARNCKCLDQWLYAVVACSEYAECKSHTDPAEPNKRLKNDAKCKWTRSSQRNND